jgi:hypothetical protein
MTIAEKIGEDATLKGSQLGFSSLLHQSACLALASDQGIVEPVDASHDVCRNGNTYEVTGNNYYRRDTRAHFTINKYKLLNACITNKENKEKFYYDAATAEDNNNTRFFSDSKDGKYNTEKSDYTDVFQKLRTLSSKLSSKDIEHIG